jgi:hypothetical protein
VLSAFVKAADLRRTARTRTVKSWLRAGRCPSIESGVAWLGTIGQHTATRRPTRTTSKCALVATRPSAAFQCREVIATVNGIQRHWIVCIKGAGQDGSAKLQVRYASDATTGKLRLATTQEDALRFDTKTEAEACAQLHRERGIVEQVDVLEVAGTWRK